MADWSNYNRQIERLKPEIRRVLKDLQPYFDSAGEIGEYMSDDYGLCFEAKAADGTPVIVSVQVWDSGDADDGIYGVHGNLLLQVEMPEGRVPVSVIPDNFTDRVWVDYTDDDEWDRKMSFVRSAASDIQVTSLEK